MTYPTKEFLEIFKKTPGALSVAESIAIMNIAAMAPKWLWVELGSHKGKSGMSAAYVFGDYGQLQLIDPIYSDVSLAAKVESGVKSVSKHNLDVRCISGYSFDVIAPMGNISYLFWDSGEHGGEVLEKEKMLIEDRIAVGGIVCSHDIGNQFSSQKEAMDYLVNTGKYEWIPINWQEIFDYMKENNITEEDNDSWHTYPDLPHSPNFVGAIRRK